MLAGVLLSLKLLGEDPSSTPPASGSPSHFDLQLSSFQSLPSPSPLHQLSSSVSVSSHFWSLMRTLVIRFRVYPGNPGSSHLYIFNLITSAQILFPNKVIFIGSGDLDVGTSV